MDVGFLLRAAYMAFAAFALVVFFGKIRADSLKMKCSGNLNLKNALLYLTFCVGVGTVLGVGFRVFSWLLSLFGV